MVIDQKERDYKKTIEDIKNVIKGNKASEAINTIRQTKEGKILITTDKDEGAIQELHKVIREGTDMGIRLKGMTNNRETEIIHIKGMDITTTTKDIITAIEKTTGALEENSYKIGNCRPNANNTLAVTVTAQGNVKKINYGKNHKRRHG